MPRLSTLVCLAFLSTACSEAVKAPQANRKVFEGFGCATKGDGLFEIPRCRDGETAEYLYYYGGWVVPNSMLSVRDPNLLFQSCKQEAVHSVKKRDIDFQRNLGMALFIADERTESQEERGALFLRLNAPSRIHVRDCCPLDDDTGQCKEGIASYQCLCQFVIYIPGGIERIRWPDD